MASPLTVYRKYVPDSDQNTWIDAMQVTPFADAVEQGLAGFKPDYVEGPNETHHRGDDLLRYIDWTAAFVQEMHGRGYKVCGFSFATGNPGLPFPGDPDPDDVRHLCERGWAGVDAVGWHCYWGNQGFTPYNALRCKSAYDFALSIGVTPPPFIIGECGRDAVEGGQRGWKASGVSGDAYALELRAYGGILASLSYVLGATVFTATPTGDWQSFSTEGLPVAGIPKLGPHCIQPGSDSTLAWARQAAIVKQIDRTDVLRAVKGGTNPMDPVTQMVLAQNALLADAQYDIVKMLAAVQAGQPVDAALLQDAKVKVNALNPGKFVF